MATSTATKPLTPYQVQRYSRHIIMPQVGSAGQRKLLEAKVLMVGAGGLGSPISIYLTLAGVGTIGIVDFDTVDVTNLQRQILHQNDDIGRPKVQSAKETLLSYNPDVNVVIHEEPLLSDNAMEIISGYDVIINGADNFPARYLVNDAAYLCGKPLVDGSILLFDGQSTVYIPGQGCYRCLFPDAAAPRRGAELRRGRRVGRAARTGGHHPGHGDGEAHHGTGRIALGPAAHHRRDGHELPYTEDAPQPGLPALRRQPHRYGAHRLRGVLRSTGYQLTLKAVPLTRSPSR